MIRYAQFIVLLLVALLAGCSTTTRTMTSQSDGQPDRSMARACQQFIERQGGIADDPASQQRVEGIVEQLLSPGRAPHVKVCILNCTALRAYAWSDGWVIVSKKLARTEDEQLLAAGIAHELGHLLADEHLKMPDESRVNALISDVADSDLDSEIAADRIGMLLLSSAGIDPDAMQQLLAVLEDDENLSTTLRRGIGQRIIKINQFRQSK